MLLKVLINAVFSICIALIMSPIVLSLMRKVKAGQPILHYVDNHTSKAGTPTMGGLIFLISALGVSISTLPPISSPLFVAILGVVGYAFVGISDDISKVKSKRNMGLTPAQKLVGQISLSLILSVYAYFSNYLPDGIVIPFFGEVQLGWYRIILDTIALVAIVNCVNLTDGLDGLVSMSGSVACVAFSIILILSAQIYSYTHIYTHLMELSAFGMAFGGGIFAFIVLNSFPAKIFMGDTGSLAIGGVLGILAVFSGNTLYLLLIGLVYVISGVSVIMQVIYFKLTHKRIFLMAPFHHHLERRGIHENKIVAIYTVTSVLVAMVSIIFYVR